MPSRDFEHYFESRFLHANIFAKLANFMILTCPVKFFQYSQTSHQVSSLEVNFKGFYRPVNIANQCAKFRVHANFFGVSLHFFNLVGIELSINACKQVILVKFVKFGGKMARLMYIFLENILKIGRKELSSTDFDDDGHGLWNINFC